MRTAGIVSALAWLCLASSAALAQDAKPEEKVHEVTAEPFKITVELDGVFVAEQMTEVALRPEEWAEFTVVEAVPHGSDVKKDDVLIRFETEGIDRAIVDKETDLKLAELSITQAEKDLPQLEETLTLDLVAAERAHQQAEQDLERFVAITRPQREKSAEFSLKSSQHSLQYALEELEQLQKMYDADDLTEETEEIILTRQRHDVERSRFSLEQSQIRRDETLQIDLPREDETLGEQLKRTTLALEKARNALDLTLNEKRISLEKEKREHDRAQQQLEKLQQDRQKMELRAPADGIVYYGRNVDGKWPGISNMTNQLRPFGKVTGNDVLVTIVRQRPMHIRVTVPEKDLQHVQPGVRASSAPTVRSDQKVDGVVMAISNVPVADGEYAGRISAPLGDEHEALMPGMTCKVRLVPYEKAEAITVPPAALRTEPADDSKHFVTVVEDDEQRKQPVTVGKRTDSRVEILSGLQAGDRVLLSAPKEEGP